MIGIGTSNLFHVGSEVNILVYADSETVFANSTKEIEVDSITMSINDFFERENTRFTELYLMI